MYFVYRGINKQPSKVTIIKKNLILSTCFGIQRYGPHRVVTCRFLCHVSMHRYLFSCVICRCWHRRWLFATVNTPTGHSRWKIPCHVTTSDTLVPMLRVSHRYTHGSRPDMRCKMAALLLHDQQVLAQNQLNYLKLFMIFLNPYWQFPRDRSSNWVMRPFFQTVLNKLINSSIIIWWCLT